MKTLIGDESITLTPESEGAGRELSVRASAAVSLRLRGLEEGGLGGKGLFNLAGEGVTRLGSEGGSFSLEGLCLREEGRGLAELVVGVGLGEEGSSAASLRGFLGSMKCFIFVRTNDRAMEMERGK